jgi:hypothetical protein
MENFIKLNLANYSGILIIEINPSFIESMTRNSEITTIITFSGNSHYVKETPDEIKKLSKIKKSFNY